MLTSADLGVRSLSSTTHAHSASTRGSPPDHNDVPRRFETAPPLTAITAAFLGPKSDLPAGLRTVLQLTSPVRRRVLCQGDDDAFSIPTNRRTATPAQARRPCSRFTSSEIMRVHALREHGAYRASEIGRKKSSVTVSDQTRALAAGASQSGTTSRRRLVSAARSRSSVRPSNELTSGFALAGGRLTRGNHSEPLPRRRSPRSRPLSSST